MAAGDITINNLWKLNQANQVDPIDFDGDTIKAMFLTNVYAVNQAHEYISDVNANEVATGTAYVAGGPAIAGKTVALNSGTVEFDGNDVSVAKDAAGFTNARYVAIYKDTGVASTSRIIAWLDLGSDRSNVDGAVNLQWNANGIINW